MENQHIHEGKIVVIEGPQRSGKTMAMSIFAYRDALKKKTIYTNLAYTFKYKPLNFNELTLRNENKELRDCTLTLDELNFFLDSRGSMTKQNKEFTYFLLQVKKQGIDLYGTTHGIGYLDLRFRENYDYHVATRVFPEKRPSGVAPEILRLVITNGPTQKTMKKTINIKCKEFLGMYDPTNIFNPFSESEADKYIPKLPRTLASKIVKPIPGFVL